MMLTHRNMQECNKEKKNQHKILCNCWLNKSRMLTPMYVCRHIYIYIYIYIYICVCVSQIYSLVIHLRITGQPFPDISRQGSGCILKNHSVLFDVSTVKDKGHTLSRKVRYRSTSDAASYRRRTASSFTPLRKILKSAPISLPSRCCMLTL